MISKNDLMDLAGEFSLDVNVVEKDYVLGWLLAGIRNQRFLSNKWIFKGGTCLKKCYFETYRFSEDLDYTLIDESQIDANFLTMCFTDIAQWLYKVAGIEIPKETIQFYVIARSEATWQSMYSKPLSTLYCFEIFKKYMDCHVASLLAMTEFYYYRLESFFNIRFFMNVFIRHA